MLTQPAVLDALSSDRPSERDPKRTLRSPRRKGYHPGQRAAENLQALMKRYAVSPQDIVAVLKRNVTFDAFIADLRKRPTYAIPRETVARIADLFANRAIDEASRLAPLSREQTKQLRDEVTLPVYQQIMTGRAPGGLAWLLTEKANSSTGDDPFVARQLGFKSVWDLRNLYRMGNADEFSADLVAKFSDYFYDVHNVDPEITQRALRSPLIVADTVAQTNVRQVPVLRTSDWIRLSHYWGAEGDAGLSRGRVDALFAEIMSWPDVRYETIDVSITNDTSVLYVVEDGRNDPKIPQGSHIQVDLASTELVKDRYYVVLIGQAATRQPVVGRYRPARESGTGGLGLLVADNEAADPLVLTPDVKVVGRAWKVITDI